MWLWSLMCGGGAGFTLLCGGSHSPGLQFGELGVVRGQ